MALGAVAGAAALTRARFRVDRAPTLLVFALVLITAFLFATAATLLERAFDLGVRQAVNAASPVQRSLAFTGAGRIDAGDGDPLQGVVTAGAALEERLPPSVRALVDSRGYVVQGIEYLVADPPRPISEIRLRYRSGIEEQIRYVKGRPPTGATERIEIPGPVRPGQEPRQADVYEVALSTATATEIRVDVGTQLVLLPDPEGINAGTSAAPRGVRVVGLFDVIDPNAAYWLEDTSLHAPSIEIISTEIRIYHATVLISPDAYPKLIPVSLGDDFPYSYSFQMRLDPERLRAGEVEQLASDLTRLQAAYPFSSNADLDTPSLRTGLADIVQGYAGQRRTAEAALALAGMGPAAAAAGALALVASMLIRRRRRALVVVRGRGAGTWQVLVAQLLEALLLVVPAAALGYLAVALGTGGAPGPSAIAVVLGVAVAAVAVLTLVAVPLTRAPIGAGEREGGVSVRTRPARLVFEALIVVVAIVGVSSLASRGLTSGGARGFDPYLAAVPVLLAVAAGVICVRLYPLPIRLFAALAGFGRGLVPALALRNASREGAARLPLIVLLLATAMGVFSSVVLLTVEQGQVTSAWQQVGADFRVDARVTENVAPELDVEAVPAVVGSAGAYVAEGRVAGAARGPRTVTFQAVEPRDYAAVVSGTPVALDFPEPLLERTWPEGTGSRARPIAAIVSADLANEGGAGVGQTLSLLLPRGQATFTVVAVRPRFPGIPAGRSFVVTALDAIRAAFPEGDLRASSIFIRAPEAAEPAIRAAMEPYGQTVALESRTARFTALRDAPLVSAVNAGFALAVAVALAYSALALASGLTIALGERVRQFGLLRTMGLGRRQLMSVILLEHAPVILVALATGVALGIGIALLLAPALGLERLIGPQAEIRPRVDPLHVFVVGVVPIAIVAAAVFAASWLIQRGDLARAVRSMEA